MTTIPLGLCWCGCGQPTRLAIDTCPREGRTKGQPLRYLKGHNQRGRVASDSTRARMRASAARRPPISEVTREKQRTAAQRRDNTNIRAAARAVPAAVRRSRHWKGGRRLSRSGYVMIRLEDEKRYVFEHVLVVEKALGHSLPAGAVIHHQNENKADNRGANLVACQDDAYHVELHRKLRVLRAGGDPWTDRLCYRCGLPKPCEHFYAQSTKASPFNPTGCSSICAPCGRARRRGEARVAA